MYPPKLKGLKMTAFEAKALSNKFRNIESNPEAKKIYENIISKIEESCKKGLFKATTYQIGDKNIQEIIGNRLESDGFVVKRFVPTDQRDAPYWIVTW